jgi:hypothetical protein
VDPPNTHAAAVTSAAAAVLDHDFRSHHTRPKQKRSHGPVGDPLARDGLARAAFRAGSSTDRYRIVVVVACNLPRGGIIKPVGPALSYNCSRYPYGQVSSTT